jgi:hypothetical protein
MLALDSIVGVMIGPTLNLIVVKRRAVEQPTPPEDLAFLKLPSLAILQL